MSCLNRELNWKRYVMNIFWSQLLMNVTVSWWFHLWDGPRGVWPHQVSQNWLFEAVSWRMDKVKEFYWIIRGMNTSLKHQVCHWSSYSVQMLRSKHSHMITHQPFTWLFQHWKLFIRHGQVHLHVLALPHSPLPFRRLLQRLRHIMTRWLHLMHIHLLCVRCYHLLLDRY